jgi:hypothetical protein
MTMLRILLAATLLGLVTFAAPSAHAVTWSKPFTLSGRYLDVDLGDAPQVALNAKGDLVAAWIGPHGYSLALGDARHGFGRPSAAGVDEPQVAMGARGRALVVGTSLEDDRGYYALLPRGGGKVRAHRVGTASSEAVGVALADGSFAVAYRSGATLHALHLSAAGRRLRSVTVSTSARSDDDLEVRPDGAVCCGPHATSWRTADGVHWSAAATAPDVGADEIEAAGLGPVDPDDQATVAAPLGAATILAWPSKKRWRAASLQDGTFTPVPAPDGRPAVARLVSAGDLAALAWYSYDHRAHVSVARP